VIHLTVRSWLNAWWKTSLWLPEIAHLRSMASKSLKVKSSKKLQLIIAPSPLFGIFSALFAVE
jgi:hypothetical protein